MAKVLWEELLQRIESGMTTGADADIVRDLLDEKLDLEIELAKFGIDDEEFADNDIISSEFDLTRLDDDAE